MPTEFTDHEQQKIGFAVPRKQILHDHFAYKSNNFVVFFSCIGKKHSTPRKMKRSQKIEMCVWRFSCGIHLRPKATTTQVSKTRKIKGNNSKHSSNMRFGSEVEFLTKFRHLKELFLCVCVCMCDTDVVFQLDYRSVFTHVKIYRTTVYLC